MLFVLLLKDSFRIFVSNRAIRRCSSQKIAQNKRTMSRKAVIKLLLYTHIMRYCNNEKINLKDLREIWFQATGITYLINVMNECLEELRYTKLLNFERISYYEICITE